MRFRLSGLRDGAEAPDATGRTGAFVFVLFAFFVANLNR